MVEQSIDLFALVILDQLADASGVADAPYYDTRWINVVDGLVRDGYVTLGQRTRRYFRDISQNGVYIRLYLTEAGRKVSVDTRSAATV